MMPSLADLKFPALISLLVVLPFMLLELASRREFHEAFPLALFALMWLLGLVFLLILMPLVRSLRAGERGRLELAGVLVRVAMLGLIAWLWVNILLDQLPCFLGVPFCD
jgi:hypothetical protein